MYPIQIPQEPAPGRSYVPYFYQQGLHYQLPIPTTGRSREFSPAMASPYDFSRSVNPFDGVSAEPQTVEQIIRQGYFGVPGGDPVTAIITDRQHTSRLGLDDVIDQVRQRYAIHHRNLHEIELGKCAAINAVYHHEAYVGPPTSKQMYAKHKAIQDLYQQEREERTSLWKDVSRLRTLLPETAQLYLAAYRKASVLADPGDAP